MKKVLIIIFAFNIIYAHGQPSQVKNVVAKLIGAKKLLQSAKFTMYCEERLIDGTFAKSERLVKLNVSPKQIYFYSVTPLAGTEILWKEGFNEDKMLIGPSGFPYVAFSIKPNSTIARKDSHHPISDMGFEYAINMIEYYVKSYGDELYKQVTIKDTVQWDNRSCIHLIVDYKNYNSLKYTVKQNENITDIARKYYVNDYLILILNPSIDNFDDVKAGQVINVPNFYCKKIEFYIDRSTWLPVKQTIYDQKGVYEKFEFKSLIVNPHFKPEEFTSEYKDYKF